MLANRYELQNRIGTGGMGEVFLAHDRLTDSQIALKRVLLNPGFLAFKSKSDSNYRLALAREFKTLSSLRHPHIVSVLDYGFDEDQVPYFTMEYLSSAQNLLAGGNSFNIKQKFQMLIEILQGVAYLHRRGLLHRDLKPNNIMVVNNQIKIIDFGLAVEIEKAQKVAGTLIYMAPELFEGSLPSQASDLYTVGLLAYQLFTGRYPFDISETVINLINNIVTEPIDCSVLPAEIAPIVSRLLKKSPQHRYQNAWDVITDLEQSLTEPFVLETPTIRESYLQASRFVGRDSELAQLSASLQKLEQNEGSLWLIGGESGVGKSRLVEELRTSALLSGVRVVTGQGVEGGGLPYQLWRDILPLLLLSADLTPLEESVLKEILPKIEQWVGHAVADVEPLNSITHQQRLELTIAEVIKRKKQLWLIVLEDLQWTAESRNPLNYVFQQLAHLPIMIVGTYRNDEAPHLVDEIPHTHQLKLSRLTNNHIAKLTTAMIGGIEPNNALVEFIQHQSEGNVFFAVEVVRALAEEVGYLANIGKSTLPESILAGGMQSIVRRRLAQVPQWGQPLLEFAAVSGRQLDLTILRQIAPECLENHTLDEWLHICSEAVVLEINEAQWRFNPAQLREAILADIDIRTLPRLHEKVAVLIEKIYTNNIVAYAETLANHWHGAGNPSKELEMLCLAVEPLLTVSQQFGLAAPLLLRTLPLLETHETDLDTQLRVYWLLSHGVHFPEAERVGYTETGYQLAQEHHRPDWQHRIGLRRLRDVFDPSEIRAIAQPAHDYYLAHQDTPNRIMTEVYLVEAEIRSENLAEAQQWANKLLDEVSTSNIPNLEMSIRFRLSRIAHKLENYAELINHNLRIYEISKAGGDVSGMASTLVNLGVAYKFMGDLDTSLVKTKEAFTKFRQVNNIRGQGIAYVNISDIYVRQQDWEQAENVLQEAIRFALERGLRETLIPEYLYRVCIVWRETGRLTDTTRLVGHFLGNDITQEYYPEEAEALYASLANAPQEFLDEGAKLSQVDVMNWILGESNPFAQRNIAT